MGAVWIAGLVIFMSLGMFFTLALCRSAAIADRGADRYLPDEYPAGMTETDLQERREAPPVMPDDETAPRLGQLHLFP